jgi:alpha-L-fucosidase 2
LRVPNALKLSNGASLKVATGKNPNPFYQTEDTPAPIVSEKSTIKALELKATLLYDLPTQKGGIYTLVGQ